MSERICGIYKITSPTGRIYIGQSINIQSRISYYKYKHPNYQTKLYNSIKKHGWHSHLFEVIELCCVDMLNKRERYWQDFYDVLGKNGLNCILTRTNEKKHIDSIETREKKRKTWLGRKHTEETKKKMSEAQRGLTKKKKERDGSLIRNNISGKKINMLTATENFKYIEGRKGVYWEFICECGNKKFIHKNSVTNKANPVKSCGCLSTKKEIPRIGRKFGRLTILEFLGFDTVVYGKEKRIRQIAHVSCLCECGNVLKKAKYALIKKGHTKSCGCYRTETLEKTRRKRLDNLKNKKQ